MTLQAMLQELCGSVQVHLDTFRQYSQFYAAQYELDKLFGKYIVTATKLAINNK